MTTVVKKHASDNYHIVMEIKLTETGGYYVVQACPRVSNDLFGFPVRRMVYALNEKKNAEATFRRYKKAYV